MDQDFHYYGTYYAARVGGNYSQEDATLIAKASNFIDFLSNERYAGYWHIVSNTEKSTVGYVRRNVVTHQTLMNGALRCR
ncbi:MAG: DUF6765 family protein [Rivularia sp. (in: cyanobacteria)]